MENGGSVSRGGVGEKTGLLIHKHDHFTPTREIEMGVPGGLDHLRVSLAPDHFCQSVRRYANDARISAEFLPPTLPRIREGHSRRGQAL